MLPSRTTGPSHEEEKPYQKKGGNVYVRKC